ncbi:amino acid adenylation domain-containing protein [Bizionia paragorgiae]|uniref:amino acid adenylation domain-containing protein n=1 Tax=Bizionia paragorgiae TaxID=283786 RepID=UPI003A919FC0
MPAEEKIQLEKFNHHPVKYPEGKTIVELFIEQVKRNPTKVAVVFNGKEITFKELDEKSNELANYLLDKYHVEKGDLVSIKIERSEWIIITIFAILKTGAAYVPIDIAYPEERIQYLETDSKCKVSINEEVLLDFKNTTLVSKPVHIKSTSKDLVYVVYTSGSTGNPKGVMIENQSILNTIYFQKEIFGEKKSIQFFSYSFDAFAWETYATLLFNGTLHILSDDCRKNPKQFGEYIFDNDIEIVTLPASYLDKLDLSKLAKAKILMTGGEAPSYKIVTEIIKYVRYYNAYGPTEASVTSSIYEIENKERIRNQIIPIGKPIPNTAMYILDETHNLQPIGAIGELYLGGAGLAKGYLNRPDLTNDKFINNPFVNGEKMYKTGDLARWLPDGNVQFIGRKDTQVKLRGYRIELGEIENALISLPSINQVAVVIIASERDKYLVAYYTSDSELKSKNIREALKNRLPEHMIPSYFKELSSMPLTPNGKIDREALSNFSEKDIIRNEYVPARDEVESILVRIWENVLNIENIGITDNFFELGGHSLKVTQLINNINKELSSTVEIRQVFEYPTIEELVKIINKDTYKPIPKSESQEYYPLSSAQKRLWILSQFEGGSKAYNIPGVLELKGNLDIPKLEQAFKLIFQRHSSLRTSFLDVNGEIVQQVIDAKNFKFELEKQAVEHKNLDKEIKTFLEEEIDLSGASLLKIKLLKQEDETYYLVLSLHHTMGDGWSMQVLSEELMYLYNQFVTGNKIEFPNLNIQYHDYVLWNIEKKKKPEFSKVEDYWISKLSGNLPVLELPTEKTRPLIKTYQGNTLTHVFSKELYTNIGLFNERQKSTLFMTLLAGINGLFYRYTNNSDIILGTSIAGRTHADLENQIGLFLNTLAIRTTFNKEGNFEDLVEIQKRTLLEAYENQEYPFDDLVEKLNLNRDTSRAALFDVMVVLQNQEDIAIELENISVKPYEKHLRNVSQFDITFSFKEENERLFVLLEYNTDIYEESFISRMLTHLESFLTNAILNSQQQINEINYLSTKEINTLLKDFNNTGFAKKDIDETLLDLIAKQVALTPNAEALVFNNKSITYKELDEMSNSLANYCIENHSITPGTLIGIQMERSDVMVIVLLSILKMRCAYVPIDINYPLKRKQNIVKNSGVKYLFSSESIEEVEEELIVINIKESWNTILNYSTKFKENVQLDDLAYIIYTSGSTGIPKGVAIQHKALANYITSFEESLGNFPLYTTISFDLTVTIFVPLTKGDSVIIYPENASNTLIEDIIIDNKVEGIKLTPSHLRILVASSRLTSYFEKSRLKVMIVGGEALEYALAKEVYDKFKGKVTIYNEYGPTETTVGCTTHQFSIAEKAVSVSIGKPIINTEIYILNEALQPMPIGVVGELFIAGLGLAKGYYNQKELTDKKFVSNPFIDGQKMYRSGDLACWTKEGTLKFIGRIDDQIKLRGYRIELGDIENNLMEFPEVKDAVVTLKSVGNTEHLVGYYIANDNIETLRFREFLSTRLLGYMIPHYYHKLDVIPLTPNGKLDKKALPIPEGNMEMSLELPETPEEKLLTKVWCEVLGIKVVGIYDNFFSVGGDSIKSIQISSRLRNLGYDIPVRTLMSVFTIKEQAKSLKPIEIYSDQSEVTGIIPLTGIQEWFFKKNKTYKEHYNQSVMLKFNTTLSVEDVQLILSKIIAHHDVLRATFRLEEEVIQEIVSPEMDIFIDEHSFEKSINYEEEIIHRVNELQSTINLTDGPLLKIGLYHLESESYLFIAIHHLIVDGISWRILLEDFETLYNQVKTDKELKLPLKTDSFMLWAKRVKEYLQGAAFTNSVKYWEKEGKKETSQIKRDREEGNNSYLTSKKIAFNLNEVATKRLLTKAHLAFNTQVNDLLLAAFINAVASEYDINHIRMDMEGHGREESFINNNIGRTVGWFTSIYPVTFSTSHNTISSLVKSVKEALRSIPMKGADYLLYNNLESTTVEGRRTSQMSFNYLGQFDTDVENKSFEIVPNLKGDDIHLHNERDYDWDILGMVVSGKLEIQLLYNTNHFHDATISRLMSKYQASLEKVINYCCDYKGRELTPSDLTYSKLSITDVNHLQSKFKVLDVYPLSSMQEGMMYHSLLDPKTSHYFEQVSCKIEGELDIPVVRKTLNYLLKRHDVLRTVFSDEFDRSLQIVLDQEEFDFSLIDIRQSVDGEKIEELIEEYRIKDRNNKFNLLQGSLIRLTVLQISNTSFEFIWSYHHILMDGWCIGILLQEFEQVYKHFTNKTSIELPVVKPYSNYISWIEKRDKIKLSNYWSTYLAGYDTLATIPKKGNESQEKNKQAVYEHYISSEVVTSLQTLSREQGVTLNNIIQTSWGIVLSRYNNTRDVVFGTVVSGRPSEIEGVENMIGLFINTIPVRISYNEDTTISELLANTQKKALESDEYQHYSLAEIQGISELGRNLLDHIIVFENLPVSNKDLPNNLGNEKTPFTIEESQVFEETNYDLTLVVVPGKDVRFKFLYNSAVFSKEFITKISEHLTNVLHEILTSSKNSKVRQVEILSNEEKLQLTTGFNNTHLEFTPNETIMSLFVKQVAKKPNKSALYYKGKEMTYGELDALSNQIANYLISEKGINQGDLIGVYLERDLLLVPLLYGILKSGAAYLPLDTNNPIERIQTIIKDSEVRLLLSLEKFEAKLATVSTEKIYYETIENLVLNQASTLDMKVSSSDLAYVIYTSGSTGMPKGVMVAHHSVVNLVQSMQEKYPLTFKDSYLLKTNYVFDVSVAELFGWYLDGGTLIILPKGEEKEPLKMMKAIQENQVTHVNFVPSLFAVFLEEIENNSLEVIKSLKHIFLAGEALPLSLIKRFYALKTNISLENIYGPTEGTIYSSWYTTTGNENSVNVPIGKPISNVLLYVLDTFNNPQPIGVPGELCIAGEGLALGYLNRADLTESKFVKNPFDASKKMYRTGDLVRWSDSGNIEFLGRIDDQVKLRGYRIELGEIENYLVKYSPIKEGVVLVQEHGEQKSLVAYYVSNEEVNEQKLREYLLNNLPEYMVPSQYIVLEEMPLNTSGKLDKKVLLKTTKTIKSAYVLATSSEEKVLVNVWKSVLGIDNVGITDNFFSLGGDSIKSVQISSRLRALGKELPVKTIMTLPTIIEQARAIQSIEVIADQSKVVGEVPLTGIQQWFFNESDFSSQHYNQSVALKFNDGITLTEVKQVFQKLVEHHDVLRTKFVNDGAHKKQVIEETITLEVEDKNFKDQENFQELILAESNKLQREIILQKGPLFKLGCFETDEGTYLVVIIHHLIIDGISWRILFEDMETLHQQIKNKEALILPLKSDSFKLWADNLETYKSSNEFEKQKGYWKEVMQKPFVKIPKNNTVCNTYKKAQSIRFSLNKELTEKLLTDVHKPFNTQINDILLASFTKAFSNQFDIDLLKIDLEGHGREESTSNVKIDRTVGWFTTIYPVSFQVHKSLKSHIKETKETLRGVPNGGLDYLLLKHLEEEHSVKENKAQISFNYLGQFDTDIEGKSFEIVDGLSGDDVALESNRPYDVEITGIVTSKQLEIRLTYGEKQFEDVEMESLMLSYQKCLEETIVYCVNLETKEVTPSDLTYNKLSISETTNLQKRYDLKDAYLLSPMQEGMFFHSIYDDLSENYFEQVTCNIEGDLNIKIVSDTLEYLLARHDILRTNFYHEGLDQPLQFVKNHQQLDFTYVKVIDEVANSSEEKVLEKYKTKDKARKFDLTKGALMRLTVLKTTEKSFAFIWSYHHILMDGWCMGIIVNEFKEVYEQFIKGKPIKLPEVSPYVNYISWLQKRDKEVSANYWKKYLEGFDTVTTFPQKQVKREEYNQASDGFILDEIQTKTMHNVSRKYGVSLNTLIQTAWAMVLSRYNTTTDVVFGSVVSGRPAELAGIENMLGLFINTIPVRIKFEEGENIEDVLKKVQLNALESEEYQYHPLSEIQALSELGRDLLDHILIFENFPIGKQVDNNTKEQTGFEVTSIQSEVQINYSLNIKILPFETTEILFDYNESIYEEILIKELISVFRNSIEAIIKEEEKPILNLEILSNNQLQKVKDELSKDLSKGITEKTIQETLSIGFNNNPNKCAIVYKGAEISYALLEEESTKIANSLIEAKIPENTYVGILCEDRHLLIAAMIGILKAKLAFVPLEFGLPQERLSSILEQTQSQYILTDQKISSVEKLQLTTKSTYLHIPFILETEEKTLVEKRTYELNDPVYVYFTSGSTGKPKGVIGRNKGLEHFISWEIETFGINDSFRFSQFTNPGFDVFLRDVFVPLCAGATICIPEKDLLLTGEVLSSWIDENEISLIHCVPSFFKIFNTKSVDESLFTKLKYILLAGEKIVPFELQNWFNKFKDKVQLVNIYGPTETTLAKGYYLIQPEDKEKKYIPIKSIVGSQFVILDQSLNVCPSGVVGEIYIRTPYRSLGYLNLPEENNKVFIKNPYGDGEQDILYKTGDLGKKDRTNAIEILGRIDRQVKIRGIRVELDDIKQNILNYKGITEAVVIVRQNTKNEQYISAYYIEKEEIDVAELRAFIIDVLPNYMVPSFFIPITTVPLNVNGKLNIKMLPEPKLINTTVEVATNETQEKLIEIWSEILKIPTEDIGITNSFFELGGHSIKAFHLMSGVQKEFGVKLKLKDIFEHTTIIELSQIIKNTQPKEETKRIKNIGEKELYLLSPAQNRMFYQQMLHEGSVAFNISIPIKINGEVVKEKLEKTLRQLVKRHESLRTGFVLSEEGIFQKIYGEEEFKLEILNLENYDNAQEAFLSFIRPFELTSHSLFRAGLLEGSDLGDLLFIDIHHIVADGTSVNILVHDFIDMYQENTLEDLELRYVDYAHWMQDMGTELEQQKKYWFNQLSGELPYLDLPADFDSSEKKAFFGAEEKEIYVNVEKYQEFKKAAKEFEVSEFMLLISAYYILLSKISGNHDIIIGTDIVGRAHNQLNTIVGTFVNILPLRFRIQPEASYLNLLSEIKKVVLEAYDNQDYQYDQLVSELHKDGSIGGRAMIKVHFAFMNTLLIASDKTNAFEHLSLKSKRSERKDYEFKIEVREKEETIGIAFIYDPNLYSNSTMEVFMNFYYNILMTIINNPQQAIEDIKLEQSENFIKEQINY